MLRRTDTPEPTKTEHNIETKLLLGHDFGKSFDVDFNWINEANVETGHWQFGYAAGFNASLFRTERNAAEPWGVRSDKLGAEAYGGLGDNTLGLTFNPNVTQQYVGLNLKAGFNNNFNVVAGVAVGLTGQSEHALARLSMGWEFK